MHSKRVINTRTRLLLVGFLIHIKTECKRKKDDIFQIVNEETIHWAVFKLFHVETPHKCNSRKNAYTSSIELDENVETVKLYGRSNNRRSFFAKSCLQSPCRKIRLLGVEDNYHQIGGTNCVLLMATNTEGL